MNTEILNVQLKSKISDVDTKSTADTQDRFQWPKRALIFALLRLGLAAYGICYECTAWNLRTDGSIGIASAKMRRGVTLRAKQAMTPVLAITLGLDKPQIQLLILSSSLIVLSIVLSYIKTEKNWMNDLSSSRTSRFVFRALDMLAVPALSLTFSEITGCVMDTVDVTYFLTKYVGYRDAFAYIICSSTELALETYLWFGLLEYFRQVNFSNSRL